MVSSLWIIGAAAMVVSSVTAAVPAPWDKLDKCAESCIQKVLAKSSYQTCESNDIACYCFGPGSFTKDLQECLSSSAEVKACNPRDTVLYAAQELCMPSAEPEDRNATGTTSSDTPYQPTSLQEAIALLKGQKITPTQNKLLTVESQIANPGGLTKTQLSGVIIAGLIGIGLLGTGAYCLCHRHKEKRQLKKQQRHEEEHDLGFRPTTVKRTFSDGSDKCVRSSWAVHTDDKKNQHSYSERSMRDTFDEGLGLGKELGYTSNAPAYPHPTAKTGRL